MFLCLYLFIQEVLLHSHWRVFFRHFHKEEERNTLGPKSHIAGDFYGHPRNESCNWKQENCIHRSRNLIDILEWPLPSGRWLVGSYDLAVTVAGLGEAAAQSSLGCEGAPTEPTKETITHWKCCQAAYFCSSASYHLGSWPDLRSSRRPKPGQQ